MCYRFRFLTRRSAQKSLAVSSPFQPKSVQVSILLPHIPRSHGNPCVPGGELGKDSCKGDSGGGLFIQVGIRNHVSWDKGGQSETIPLCHTTIFTCWSIPYHILKTILPNNNKLSCTTRHAITTSKFATNQICRGSSTSLGISLES